MKQGFCFSQTFISISHLCAMQHKKIGADIFCEVLHFLGLRSGCARLFLSALRKSSVFLYCYLATVVITYDPCQIVDAFLWPLCLLLFAVCLQICFVLSSSLNQLALFFPPFSGWPLEFNHFWRLDDGQQLNPLHTYFFRLCIPCFPSSRREKIFQWPSVAR